MALPTDPLVSAMTQQAMGGAQVDNSAQQQQAFLLAQEQANALQQQQRMPRQQQGGALTNLMEAFAEPAEYTNAPQSLMDASGEVRLAQRAYTNSMTRRLRAGSKLGAVESLYDIVSAPFTRNRLEKAEDNLVQEQNQYKMQVETERANAEMEQRKQYVQHVSPLLQAKFPGMDPAAIQQMAIVAAKQNTPLEKLFPEGVEKPTVQKYFDPATGAQMGKWILPSTGKEIPGREHWMIAGPTETSGKSSQKTLMIYDEDGNEISTTFGPPGADGQPTVISQIPTGKNVEAKDYSQMTETQRKYGSMLANSSSLISEALPLMFDDDGDWNSFEVQVPNSKAKAAYLGYQNAIIQSIRPESGAAVPPEEKATAFELYLPGPLDGDVTAQAKVQRFARYQQKMHGGYFKGYKNVPAELGFTEFSTPWMNTPAGKAGAQVVAIEEAQDARATAIQAIRAEMAARQQQVD